MSEKEKESWKRLEKVEEDIDNIRPELTALRDNQIRYQISSASERADRDHVIATWREILHAALKQVGPINPRLIHAVIDDMDEFLNRAGGRRK